MAADGALVAQRLEDEGPAHTQRLLPFVHEVLGEAGVALDDLDAVVCGLGPGAYTGMRIGVATARALAQASGLRLAGAPTLAAVGLALADVAAAKADAAPAPAGADTTLPGTPLVALLDGKRREVFAAVFRVATPGGSLSELSPLAVVAADDLAGYLEQWPAAVVGGDGAGIYADRLPAAVTVATSVATPTAAMVGRAWLAGVPGAVEGFADVLPVYGRAPDAARWQAPPGSPLTAGGEA
jgi:tRNA threonylcarbamoyladenosine biosynthesis protein TsaB